MRNEFEILKVNSLSANVTKWSNTLKQFDDNNWWIIRVFDHFVGLALIEEKAERLRYVSDFKWSQNPIKLDQKKRESGILLFLRDLINIKLVKTDEKNTF